jgi:hypothetical protein
MRAILILTTLPLLASATLADEVEHPLYRSWAAHPVGTEVVMRSVTESKGRRIESTSVTRLVRVEPDRVVIESRTAQGAPGQNTPEGAQEYEYRRMFPLMPGVKKEDVGRPKGLSKDEESLEIAGKTYRTRSYESKGTTEAGPSLSRSWISDQVPGQLVKSVTTVPAASTTTTLELVEIRSPKPSK